MFRGDLRKVWHTIGVPGYRHLEGFFSMPSHMHKHSQSSHVVSWNHTLCRAGKFQLTSSLLVWMFYSERDFQISFSNRDNSRNAWKRYWRSFMVDTGILSNNMYFLSHECSVTFSSLAKYNGNPPPIRLYTNPSTFYWLMRGFHRTFATGI